MGVFLFDLAEYKETVIKEIEEKNCLAKKLLNEKFDKSLTDNERMSLEIRSTLEQEPQLIAEYIKINLFLEGEELRQHFE